MKDWNDYALCSVTLPDSELLLPADEHKSAKNICGPALAKEGLNPNNVVLYVVSMYLKQHLIVN